MNTNEIITVVKLMQVEAMRLADDWYQSRLEQLLTNSGSFDTDEYASELVDIDDMYKEWCQRFDSLTESLVGEISNLEEPEDPSIHQPIELFGIDNTPVRINKSDVESMKIEPAPFPYESKLLNEKLHEY